MTSHTAKIAWCLTACLFAGTALHAADNPASLDQQLLDDLDSSLFDGLDLPKPTRPAEVDQPLPAGEDLGQPSESDPLANIAQRMRSVERLIGERVTSNRTQSIQEDIVADLSKLIEQLQQQSSGNGPQPNSSQKSGEGSTQASTTGAQESQRPASDSRPRLEKGEAEQERLAAMERMLDQIWGHLPPRVREQMQNATVEQFLPKYERLIEDYYKRLAESP